MRRRLDLAASLVGQPRVLFLDEPTTGLDPRSRTDVWGMIRGLVADGVTVLLTTQYLDEADQLAARHRGHRPRQGHRDRDAGRAEGQDRRPGAPGLARRPGPDGRGRRADGGADRGRGSDRRRGRRGHRARRRRGLAAPHCSASSTTGASSSRSSRCARPAWTRCSSPSPATARRMKRTAAANWKAATDDHDPGSDHDPARRPGRLARSPGCGTPSRSPGAAC